jgi:hypothetical protein
MRMLTNELRVYTTLWNKYRPVILQLMSSAAEKGPQQYKLFSHEFKALNPREKSYTFTLEVSEGRALNKIKTSIVAQDLLHVLQQSKRANELTLGASYSLNMDRDFVLHVKKKVEESIEAVAVSEEVQTDVLVG